MAEKTVIEAEIKTNIKGVSKDQKAWNKELKKTKETIEDVNEEGKELIAETQILGISINGLKAGWQSAAKGAKFMFRTIKAGIASTGVGLFVLALGNITTWFSTTKRGAEFLQVAMSGLGAAFNVIIDRVAQFGGGLISLISGDISKGLKEMSDSFKNIGKEIVTDTLYTMALKKSVQDLADSQRKLNVETAQRRADIEELKLIAEDVTKSEQERLKAAKDAFDIENNLLDRRINNAEESLRLEKERQSTILDPQKEDLDALAQLEIDLANIRGESLTKQIELNNKINAIEAEGVARRLEELDARKTADAELMGELTKMPEIQTEINNQLIQADADYTAVIMGNAKKRTNFIKEQQNAQLAATANFAGALSRLAGDNKQLAIAETLINTFLAVQQTMADKTIPSTAIKFITAGTVLANGLANVQRIFNTQIPGGGGGGSSPSVSTQTPAPQMMSGAFELTGGQAPEPLRAYVVTDEMTNSQHQLANIRRRATI